MSAETVRVCVVGARGYTGRELLRLIAGHERLELVGVFGTERQRVDEAHPSLRGVVEGVIEPLDAEASEAASTIANCGCDAVFLATPHEASLDLAPELLSSGLVVFDLSGGFRLGDPALYPVNYGFTHTQPELLSKAVYGLCEWNGADLVGADLVAVPGCYATAALLSLKPLLSAGATKGGARLAMTGISGVSGAGRGAMAFGEVSLSAYKALLHRHVPEIAVHAGVGAGQISFVPHVAPFDRGLVVTSHIDLAPGVDASDLARWYGRAYEGDGCVRVLGDDVMPSVGGVAHTCFADIGWAVDGGRAVVSCALDNLLKGASGQAVQCLNHRYGFEPLTGLVPTSATGLASGVAL